MRFWKIVVWLKINLALSAEAETLQTLHRKHIDRKMPVHATSPSKVSTSFQPKGGTNPIIERPLCCSPLSLLPSPTTSPLYAHLMQLSRRVSNAFQDDKSLYPPESLPRYDFSSKWLVHDYIMWCSGKSRTRSLPFFPSLFLFLSRLSSLVSPLVRLITNADLNTFPPNCRKS